MHPLVTYITKILRKQGKKWGAFFDDDVQNHHLSRTEIIRNYRSLAQYLQNALGEELYKMTGDAPILSKAEASNATEEDQYWLYEGLSGELNMISGLPFFAISLTWIEKNTAQFYVLFDPMSDDVVCVCEGSGAQANNKRIRFLDTNSIDLGFTNKMLPAMEKSGVNFRMIGSIELEISWLARGKAQIGCYSNTELSAGLRLLIKESGGSCFEIEHEGSKILLVGYKRNLIKFMEGAHLQKT